ncbi:IS110 family transposase [Rhodococcus pyridinivorans]
MTQPASQQRIYCGIDTHADTHDAAVITDTGILVEHRRFDATPTGYQELTTWMYEHGEPISVGIEGTSSYGAGIARHLHRHNIRVLEVPRPNRQLRRNKGKSDPIDAETAARAVLARHQLSEPKHGDGPIEAIRALRVARSSAVKAATASMNALRGLIVTAPDELRTQLRGHSTTALLDACIALEADATQLTDPTHATVLALRSLARRTRELRREASELKRHLAKLVDEVAPRTSAVFGLGPDTTAVLLVTVGDNPGRLKSESSFGTSAASHRFPHHLARPTAIVSTAAATDAPTRHCTPASSSASGTAPRPAPTPIAARQRGKRCLRSSAAKSAILPGKSSPPSETITAH